MKAISLFSGGLDSMLAIKLITDQGIDVTAVHIKTGFGGTKDVTDVLSQRARMAGADFRIVDVREEYIQKVLFTPKYGYGKNFNPCIDCHGYMFRIGKAVMEELGASFIFSGEVIGQRPMSQRHDAMKQVSALAEDKDEKLILRPLCAKLMEPTTPELEGWVDREKLLDISGRSRERQLELAASYGWEDYESPGGGCLLTEAHYSDRIREFIKYDEFTVADIDLLKFGRQFRLPDGAKLAVGRDQDDNAGLQAIQSDKYIPVRLPIAGPFSLLSAHASQSDKALAAKLAITYARSNPAEEYAVTVGDEMITVSPFAKKEEAQHYFFNAKQ
ncbi:MAG: argininosuccinate synthase [Campylobacterales bacterium]|nr:argininosuccinate synthase [Campylobacterales bacterium]